MHASGACLTRSVVANNGQQESAETREIEVELETVRVNKFRTRGLGSEKVEDRRQIKNKLHGCVVLQLCGMQSTPATHSIRGGPFNFKLDN
jgi:type 1 fimbria pilin